MGNNTLFNLKGLSRKETSTVIIGTVVFLLFQWLVVGLLPAHVFMAGLFNLLFFAHPTSRKLAVMLIPFILFEMSYDWMRLYPNYKVNPIDIRGLYETEKALFGIAAEGTTLTPCESFSLHNNAIADLMSGIFYLCWVPGPIALSLWLFFKGKRNWSVRFTWAFLFVNMIGFAGYYIHPAAPPWYAINYGFHASYAPDRWGGYVSVRTNFVSQLYAYDILSDGTTGGEERFEAKGGQRIGEYSAAAGVVRTVTPWLELYAGAGYGSSTLCWNDIHGAWAKVRDYSAAGLLLDGGAVFHLGKISLLGGVSYLTARPESGPFKPVFSIGAGIGF